MPSLKARTVVWFRNDLRLHDNPLLHAAIAAKEVLPVYCFDTRQFGPTRHGALKSSPLRARFLIESVCVRRGDSNLQPSVLPSTEATPLLLEVERLSVRIPLTTGPANPSNDRTCESL